MKRTLSLIFVTLLFFTSTTNAQQGDVIDVLAKHFSSADESKVATFFSSTVELAILSEENIYSKAQAEQIIRDFFSKNKPLSVKIVHRLSSNPNYLLGVFFMTTAKEKFRVSVSLSNNDEEFVIKQIRIEIDKQQQL